MNEVKIINTEQNVSDPVNIYFSGASIPVSDKVGRYCTCPKPIDNVTQRIKQHAVIDTKTTGIYLIRSMFQKGV